MEIHFSYTVSTQTGTENQENGTLAKNEIMRWVLNGVGGDGVTVRLCVRGGGITLYVSQVTTPNEEMHDSRSNIARTEELAIVCKTIFNRQYHTPGTRGRRSSEQGETTSLYLSIEGHDEMNTFFMQSGYGNVTFGEALRLFSCYLIYYAIMQYKCLLLLTACTNSDVKLIAAS